MALRERGGGQQGPLPPLRPWGASFLHKKEEEEGSHSAGGRGPSRRRIVIFHLWFIFQSSYHFSVLFLSLLYLFFIFPSPPPPPPPCSSCLEFLSFSTHRCLTVITDKKVTRSACFFSAFVAETKGSFLFFYQRFFFIPFVSSSFLVYFQTYLRQHARAYALNPSAHTHTHTHTRTHTHTHTHEYLSQYSCITSM